MIHSPKQKAILSLCIVALSFTLLSIVTRMMNEGFSPFTQVYLRIGLGFLLTLLFFFKHINFSKMLTTSKRDWLILFLMGVIGYGLAVDFVTLGILHTQLLKVSVISSTTPFFVLFYTLLLFRKSFRPSLFLFLLVSFYGVCMISTGSFVPIITQFGIGDLFVLIFAAFSGVYVVGRKLLSSFLNDAEIAVVVMFFAFLSSLLCALVVHQSLQLSGFFNPVALVGLVLGGLLNIITTVFQNFSFRQLNAVVGSQILILQNVFAAIFGFLLYSEIISQVEFVGAILVVAGVWLYIKFAQD
jgi:drug/metabolite transporter (DMT)-like permease